MRRGEVELQGGGTEDGSGKQERDWRWQEDLEEGLP